MFKWWFWKLLFARGFKNSVLVYDFEKCYSIDILKTLETIQDFENSVSIDDFENSRNNSIFWKHS